MNYERDVRLMKKRFYLLTVLLITWMIVIFSFSAQPAKKSTDLSEGVGRKVANLVIPGFQSWSIEKQEEYIGSIDFFVRKTAHFTEYMILGSLWLLCSYNKPCRNCSFQQKIGISVGASAVYAMSDEFHQLFVDGRAGRWMDVGIDTGGAITGVVITLVLIVIYNKISGYKKNKKI